MGRLHTSKQASVPHGICLIRLGEVVKFTAGECFAFYTLRVREDADATTDSRRCRLDHNKTQCSLYRSDRNTLILTPGLWVTENNLKWCDKFLLPFDILFGRSSGKPGLASSCLVYCTHPFHNGLV